MLFAINTDNFMKLNSQLTLITVHYPHQGTIATTPTSLESPPTNLQHAFTVTWMKLVIV